MSNFFRNESTRMILKMSNFFTVKPLCLKQPWEMSQLFKSNFSALRYFLKITQALMITRQSLQEAPPGRTPGNFPLPQNGNHCCKKMMIFEG